MARRPRRDTTETVRNAVRTPEVRASRSFTYDDARRSRLISDLLDAPRRARPVAAVPAPAFRTGIVGAVRPNEPLPTPQVPGSRRPGSAASVSTRAGVSVARQTEAAQPRSSPALSVSQRSAPVARRSEPRVERGAASAVVSSTSSTPKAVTRAAALPPRDQDRNKTAKRDPIDCKKRPDGRRSAARGRKRFSPWCK